MKTNTVSTEGWVRTGRAGLSKPLVWTCTPLDESDYEQGGPRRRAHTCAIEASVEAGMIGTREVDHELARVLHGAHVRDLVQVQHLGGDEQLLRGRGWGEGGGEGQVTKGRERKGEMRLGPLLGGHKWGG